MRGKGHDGHVADCLFCAIANDAVPARIVREDELTIAFEDIAPQAPVHVLVIPRRHYRDVAELGTDDAVAAAVVSAVRAVVEQLDLTDFRVVFNTGAGGGQHVFHVHAHVLAGRTFTWPPG